VEGVPSSFISFLLEWLAPWLYAAPRRAGFYTHNKQNLATADSARKPATTMEDAHEVIQQVAEYGKESVVVAKQLCHAIDMLYKAVEAAKQDDRECQEIVTTIVCGAPIIEALLLEGRRGRDERIEKAMTTALKSAAGAIDVACFAVYSWLAKSGFARLGSAQGMEPKLRHAWEFLRNRMDDVQRLQVHMIYAKTNEAVSELRAVHADIAKVVDELRRLDARTTSSASDAGRTTLLAKAVVARTEKGGQRLKGHTGEVYSVAWSPDGRKVATGSSDSTAIIWDAAVGEPLRKLEGHSNSVRAVAWSPDGRRRLRKLEGHKSRNSAVAWSPDGRAVATASEDATAAIWDAATGERLRNLEGHRNSVLAAAWSPDGRAVVTAGKQDTAVIWDAATGEQLRELECHWGFILAVAWSPNGRSVATASGYTAAICNAATGELVRQLEGHKDYVRAVAWSPDGRAVATSSDDKTAAIWDAATGERLRKLEGHSKPVLAVAWSPDGRALATASEDKMAAIWTIKLQQD
ncbi:hypothetical protein KFL_002820010, partial [Klebsormidium nitens]